MFLLFSCRSTKYIPDDKYLFDKYKLKCDSRKIEKSELKTYLKQKPNRKILGVKFHLGLYNLSKKHKTNKFNNGLRNIGEEPVIFDEYLARKSSEQITQYLNSCGYYHAIVTDSIKYKNKKAKLIYRIVLNDPYFINKIEYSIDDSLIVDLILRDTLNSLIRSGDIINLENFNEERIRVEKYLRNYGYYDYTKQFMYFKIDSTIENNLVNVSINVKKYVFTNEKNELIESPFKIYKFDNIYIYPKYNTKAFNIKGKAYDEKLDTLPYKDLLFIYNKSFKSNKEIIYQSIYINKGDIYNTDGIKSTYTHLSSLQLNKQVNIQFKKSDSINYTNPKDTANLSCFIYMTRSKLQAYSFELEGTNSSGNLGGAASILYKHKNLFKNYEVFDFKIRGAFETLRKEKEGFTNSLELGSEANLIIQKFLLPFKMEEFIQKYNPKTNINLSYNYLKKPIYAGSIGNLGFGYVWKGNEFVKHKLNPLEINLVNIPYKSPDFANRIAGTYREYSYENHVITATNYSFTYNNQDIRKNQNSLFFKLKAESAGNILTAYNKAFNKTAQVGDYTIFKTVYSQYVKSEIDFRFYNIIDERQNLAYRFFVGAGYPYQNSRLLPIEKQYFSGGANSIRAWKMRTLGPGTYDNTEDLDTLDYPNQTADIKIEGNIEYRFKLIWIIEGALFMDIGNIWAIKKITINDDPIRYKEFNDNAVFSFNKFYDDLAVGIGFGTRFDFSFFVFRADVGLKLRDPVIQDKNKWIIDYKNYDRDALNFTIGIGYPF